MSAANVLNGSTFLKGKLVELCQELEGHLDSIAPAVQCGVLHQQLRLSLSGRV